MGRIAIAGRAPSDGVDGIVDHGRRLRRALLGDGASVRMCGRLPDGAWRTDDGAEAGDLASAVRGCEAVLLQYNPFLYGRWGFAPWLPGELRAVRRGGTRVAVMIHEAAYPFDSARGTVMGVWQRLQLRGVVAAADVVFVSIERWTRRIAAYRPRRDVRHLPVGSNLPDMRAARAESRSRLGLAEDTVAVATLSTGHPSQLVDPVREAVTAIAAAGIPVALLRLGAGAPAVDDLPPAVRLHQPGRQPAEQLAADLAAADIALMPYGDGVTTRRTGFMAALQHGVAVVAADGPRTDASLRALGGAALALVPLDGIAAAAVRLAGDATERARLAEAGTRLYAECFDWQVLSRRVLGALAEAGR